MFDEEQKTPLMVACENNHLDTVMYLLRAGAAISHKVSHHTLSLLDHLSQRQLVLSSSCQIPLLHPSVHPVSSSLIQSTAAVFLYC